MADRADPIGGVVYKAESFMAVGQVDRAETLLRGELGRHPDDSSLLLTLAKVFESRGQWPDVVSTAAAALESNPNSLNARMTLAIAGYQLDDYELMKRSLDEVLEHRPDQPTALMYLAFFHESTDRSSAGRERARALSRRALEYGGGDPWYTVTAARLERRVGSSAEARTLVDSGLEQFPTNAALLQLKTEFSSTTIDESMGIVGGLLASSPTDPALRARFEALISMRRRRLLSMLWLAPALVGLVIAFTGGPFRIGGLVAIAAASFTVWGVRNSSIEALPPVYRQEFASNAPWRVATRSGGRFSALTTFIGGVLLAFEVAAGAWLLVFSVVGWIVARFAGLSHERRSAAASDAELAARRTGDVDAAPARRPADDAVREGRWDRLFTTPIFLIPFCIIGLIPPGAPGEDGAARAATGIIAAIVGLMSVVEAAPWFRTAPRAPVTTAWRILRLAVPGVLLSLVLVGSALNLSAATGGRTIERTEQPSTPATIPPGYFDDLESPSPFPTLDIPDFDVPTIPPLDPEG